MDPQRLRVMLDQSADDDTRQSILWELRDGAAAIWETFPEWADDDVVLDALTQLASDPDEGWLGTDAAETLVWVWQYRGWIDRERFDRLTPNAKDIVRSYIELNRPDLLGGLG